MTSTALPFLVLGASVFSAGLATRAAITGRKVGGWPRGSRGQAALMAVSLAGIAVVGLIYGVLLA